VDKDLPQGAWWYNQISTENNISWYGALRMLYTITGKPRYKEGMEKIEGFFQSVWDPQRGYFHQGMHTMKGRWERSTDHFALDVQTWGIAAFGPAKIDQWLGEGAAFQVWQKAKALSGVWDADGCLKGVGYTEEHDRISVEWTAGAILAARLIADHYAGSHPDWARQARDDARSMRSGIEDLRQRLAPGVEGFSYSSRRGWIPFGWFSHDPQVVSLASTGWVLFVDAGFNPFYLPKTPPVSSSQLAMRSEL